MGAVWVILVPWTFSPLFASLLTQVVWRRRAVQAATRQGDRVVEESETVAGYSVENLRAWAGIDVASTSSKVMPRVPSARPKQEIVARVGQSQCMISGGRGQLSPHRCESRSAGSVFVVVRVVRGVTVAIVDVIRMVIVLDGGVAAVLGMFVVVVRVSGVAR